MPDQGAGTDNAALVNAVTWHKWYLASHEAHPLSGEGLVALGPLGMACMTYDADMPVEVEAEYLPWPSCGAPDENPKTFDQLYRLGNGEHLVVEAKAPAESWIGAMEQAPPRRHDRSLQDLLEERTSGHTGCTP